MRRFYRYIYINGEPLSFTVYRTQKAKAKLQEIANSQINRREKKKRFALRFKFFLTKDIKDLDNLVKTYCDVLTGILYEDDIQVYRIIAEKIPSPDNPLTVIGYKNF